MLTEYQARKIRRDMERELNASDSSVIACLAGLVAIVVLATATPEIAPSTNASRSMAAADQAQASQPAAPQQTVSDDAARGAIDTPAQVVDQSLNGTGTTDYRR